MLQSLLEQSQALTQTQQETDTVFIERPLDQLEQQTKRLLKRSIQQGSQGTPNLKDVDQQKVAALLESIQKQQAFEPHEVVQETDVERRVQTSHELLILQSIQSQMNVAQEEFEVKFEQEFTNEWERCKRSVFESVGQQRLVSGALGSSLMPQPKTFTPSVQQPMLTPMAKGKGVHEDVSVTKVQAYATAVKQINDIRLTNRPVAVFKKFKEAIGNSGDARFDGSIDAWELLAYVVGEGVSGDDTLRERQLSQAYGARQDSFEASELEGRFLKGGRKWLEQYFQKYLAKISLKTLEAKDYYSLDKNEHDRLASQVARMSTLDKLELWVKDVLIPRSEHQQWEFVEQKPLWVVIFYLLRAGEYKDALEFASAFEHFFANTERNFLEYLSAWVAAKDHNLPKDMQAELLSDFNSRVRDGAMRNSSASHRSGLLMASAVDPYKYLVFRILGRIVDDHVIPKSIVNVLAGGILGWEDEMWIQLMFVRQSPSESLHVLYTNYISKLPADYWTDDGMNIMRYFYVLTLCGQFERAVAYLWNIDTKKGSVSPFIDALHFGFALSYYGCLAISPSFDSVGISVLSDTEGSKHVHVDYFLLLKQYLSSVVMSSSRPFEAIQYLLTLEWFSDGYLGHYEQLKSQDRGAIKQTVLSLIIDVILESEKVDEFLGCIQQANSISGSFRSAGYLDHYVPLLNLRKEDMKSAVIKPAAQRAELHASRLQQHIGDSGTQYYDVAVNLYNLAEEYDKVLDIISSRVSQGLHHRSMLPAAHYAGALVKGTAKTYDTRWADVDIVALKNLEQDAQSVLEFYNQNWLSSKIRLESRQTLVTLLQFVKFFVRVDNLLESGGTQSVGSLVGMVQTLGIVPFESSQDLSPPQMAALADSLKRDYSDLVLAHFGQVMLAVEIVYVLAYNTERSRGISAQDIAKKSRQLQSYVTLVGRTFNLDIEDRKAIMSLDELIE